MGKIVIGDDPLDACPLPWLVARVVPKAPLDILDSFLDALWILGVVPDFKLQTLVL